MGEGINNMGGVMHRGYPPPGKLARAKLAGTGPRCIGKNIFKGGKLASTEGGGATSQGRGSRMHGQRLCAPPASEMKITGHICSLAGAKLWHLAGAANQCPGEVFTGQKETN